MKRRATKDKEMVIVPVGAVQWTRQDTEWLASVVKHPTWAKLEQVNGLKLVDDILANDGGDVGRAFVRGRRRTMQLIYEHGILPPEVDKELTPGDSETSPIQFEESGTETEETTEG